MVYATQIDPNSHLHRENDDSLPHVRKNTLFTKKIGTKRGKHRFNMADINKIAGK